MKRAAVFVLLMALCLLSFSQEATTVSSAPGTGKLTPDEKTRLEASLQTAKLLYEMDTAGWAGTDTVQPVLEKLAVSFPPDLSSIRYVCWKDGRGWNLLFFYDTSQGEMHPLVWTALDAPLTRTSRGETRLFDLSKKEVLGEIAAPLAKAAIKGAECYEKAFGKKLVPPVNSCVVPEGDGTYWFFTMQGDVDYSSAVIGPDFAVHIDADIQKAIEQRRSVKYQQKFPIKLESGMRSWPAKPILKIETDYPEAEVMLFMMFHPELSPLVAGSPKGTWILRAGITPEFRGSATPDKVYEELSKPPQIPGGMLPAIGERGKKELKEKEWESIRDAVRVSASSMFFAFYMESEARKAIAGNSICPGFPEPPDAILDMNEKKDLLIYFVQKGTDIPCLAVRPVENDAQRKYLFEVQKEAPEPSEKFKPNLALLRAAKERVDAFLGPGEHYYYPVYDKEKELGQVYAWSQITRNAGYGNSEDARLVGSCVNMMFGLKGDEFVDLGDAVIDCTTPGWDISGVKSSLPLGIKTAADPDNGFFGEFDILRCLMNQWLCPRLMKHGSGWALVQGDGSYKMLDKRECKKIKSLPKEIYPFTILRNTALEEYKKKSPTILKAEE